MSFTIQTNVNAMLAQENLRVNGEFQSRTIEHLTSGYRINQSGDDAAGLTVANKYRSDIAELTQGVRNANDGISALQIVDGGLNNISKIIDRLRTLATQAASSTFSGNRTVLDNEFQALKLEIDRQAANVGLAPGGVNNAVMQIFIGGGGSNQSNSNVQVDLSGSANQVSSTGLGIAGTTLLAGGSVLGSADIRGATLLNNAAGAQTFTFQLGNTAVTATVTGGTGGITTDNAVAQLNSQLNGYGISAFVDSSTGILNFTSNAAFSVVAGAVAGGGTAVATAGATTANLGMYRSSGQAAFAAVGAGHTETLTFTKNGVSTVVTLDSVSGGNVTAALTTLNRALAPLGITALAYGATAGGVMFQSSGSFSVERTGTAGEGVYAANAAATPASAPSAGSNATANALSALTALANAIGNLGVVQGKVGTGQNKLQYAVVLAQSQVSNYSAAESRIRDADVAQEAANLTKAQVLQQASLAAMAQANSAPQAVVALLRG